ncbi:DUF5753 domain-containing protein [Actinomadura roseirufa]|uniref:DUF5753 domain-containing protein n=1 Tax=Actinomadura roseirufa TaxID=2094049 RepID=UPI0010410D05|nr:DUF5753 domain-containing protein [Actinomadura roseirufa]
MNMSDARDARVVLAFAARLEDAWFRAGPPSFDEAEKMSRKIRMPVGEFRFEPLASSTIQEHVRGRRKRLPRWEWTASLVTTLRALAAGRGRNPDTIGTVREWKIRYEAAQARLSAAGARADDAAPGRADTASVERLAATLALSGPSAAVLGQGRAGAGAAASSIDHDGSRRSELLDLARRTYAGLWWPPRLTDLVPDWFAPYLSLEPAARVIRGYEPQYVHGLLQTPGYAEAVVRLEHQSAPAAQIERRVELRMLRQELLTRPNAPHLWVVLDEATLHRQYGDRRILRGQIRHLIALSERKNVTIQVMAFTQGGHHAAEGAVAILRFAERQVPDVVYLEHPSGARYPTDPANIHYHSVTLDRLIARAQQPHAAREFLHRRLREI